VQEQVAINALNVAENRNVARDAPDVREEAPAAMEFMTEEEQGDDPESIQRWIEELRAIPALPITPEQEAALFAWRQKVKEFNVEAVRRQMEEGIR